MMETNYDAPIDIPLCKSPETEYDRPFDSSEKFDQLAHHSSNKFNLDSPVVSTFRNLSLDQSINNPNLIWHQSSVHERSINQTYEQPDNHFFKQLPSHVWLDQSQLTINQTIGHGAFGVVYSGLYLNKPVAIKVVNQLSSPSFNQLIKQSNNPTTNTSTDQSINKAVPTSDDGYQPIKHSSIQTFDSSDQPINRSIHQPNDQSLDQSRNRSNSPSDQQLISRSIDQSIQSEAFILSLIPAHPNIVDFVGVCYIDHSNYQSFDQSCKQSINQSISQFALVTGLCNLGNLESLLLKHSIKQSLTPSISQSVELSIDQPLTFAELESIAFALQAARAVNHLHHHSIIHGDLAARNYLIDRLVSRSTDEPLVLKVADFGLATVDMSQNNTISQCPKRPQLFAVSWAAPELLVAKSADQSINRSTDCWSFGVSVWEMFHRRVPYGNLHKLKVGFAVSKKGMRLSNDQSFNSSIKLLINSCFNEPDRRPSFDFIVRWLEEVYEYTAKQSGDRSAQRFDRRAFKQSFDQPQIQLDDIETSMKLFAQAEDQSFKQTDDQTINQTGDQTKKKVMLRSKRSLKSEAQDISQPAPVAQPLKLAASRRGGEIGQPKPSASVSTTQSAIGGAARSRIKRAAPHAEKQTENIQIGQSLRQDELVNDEAEEEVSEQAFEAAPAEPLSAEVSSTKKKKAGVFSMLKDKVFGKSRKSDESHVLQNTEEISNTVAFTSADQSVSQLESLDVAEKSPRIAPTITGRLAEEPARPSLFGQAVPPPPPAAPRPAIRKPSIEQSLGQQASMASFAAPMSFAAFGAKPSEQSLLFDQLHSEPKTLADDLFLVLGFPVIESIELNDLTYSINPSINQISMQPQIITAQYRSERYRGRILSIDQIQSIKQSTSQPIAQALTHSINQSVGLIVKFSNDPACVAVLIDEDLVNQSSLYSYTRKCHQSNDQSNNQSSSSFTPLQRFQCLFKVASKIIDNQSHNQTITQSINTRLISLSESLDPFVPLIDGFVLDPLITWNEDIAARFSPPEVICDESNDHSGVESIHVWQFGLMCWELVFDCQWLAYDPVHPPAIDQTNNSSLNQPINLHALLISIAEHGIEGSNLSVNQSVFDQTSRFGQLIGPLIRSCLAFTPSNRPTLSEIKQSLDLLITQVGTT